MVAPVLRAIASIVTVIVAVAVSSSWGDDAGKLVAAITGAVIIAIIEWFVQWSPRHLAWARGLLDPRAQWTGVWTQEVELVSDTSGSRKQDRNSFAVFRVGYESGYWVDGRAYDDNGEEIAHWWSVPDPAFTKDGRTMSYVWKGKVTDADSDHLSPDRTGLGTMVLSGGERDSGIGEVQHVDHNRRLDFKLMRITGEYLRKLRIDGYTPASLKDEQIRAEFAVALALARSRGRRSPPDAQVSES